jgi:hypothetical protein
LTYKNARHQRKARKKSTKAAFLGKNTSALSV